MSVPPQLKLIALACMMRYAIHGYSPCVVVDADVDVDVGGDRIGLWIFEIIILSIRIDRARFILV